MKYLKSPVDPVTGEEVGLTLFSNTINGGAFDDAQNATQLYRYLSNNISAAAGDARLQHRRPAGHQDLLHQQRPGRRHAVLPVLGAAQPGAGRSSAPSWWPTFSRAPVSSAPALAPAPATSTRAIRPGSAMPPG